MDALARTLGEKAAKVLGQPFVIENKPGAGGNIGADYVARAPADGYTLLITSIGMATNKSLYGKLSYDPVKDFAPVSLLAVVPNVLVTNSSQTGIKTLADMVASAKKAPGKLSYASAGNGSPAHLSAELFKSMLGLDILHVPYKGAPPAMIDQIAGRVDIQFANPAVALPQIKAGKLVALAVTSPRRFGPLPEVPTMAEAGVPNFEADQWLAYLAPRATPRPVVERLVREINKALAMDDVRATLAQGGMTAAAPAKEAPSTGTVIPYILLKRAFEPTPSVVLAAWARPATVVTKALPRRTRRIM